MKIRLKPALSWMAFVALAVGASAGLWALKRQFSEFTAGKTAEAVASKLASEYGIRDGAAVVGRSDADGSYLIGCIDGEGKRSLLIYMARDPNGGEWQPRTVNLNEQLIDVHFGLRDESIAGPRLPKMEVLGASPPSATSRISG